ncbi:MAG TPA: M48 family metallopeptidase [Thermoanaerobaculia bacterium]|jgi:Zn-dependent protease with chaperone function
MRMLLKIGLAVAAVAVVAAVVMAQPAPAKNDAAAPRSEDKRFEVQITDEMVRHSRIRDTLYFVNIAWSLVVMLGLLFSGASRKMRDLAARWVKRPYWQAAIYIVLFILATTIIDFPLSYYSGFVVPHQFDLTEQSFGSWMGDLAKGLAVGLAIMPLLGAWALLGIRKVKNWWAVLWAVSIPLIVLLVVIQPIVLDPIFNKFEPLQDQVLRQKLLDLASRAGIEGGRIYQVNKSKQTKTMNAYVNGIGPTNRIVMWDTLLAKMTHDEVLAVMGHEMGHYVMRHIWKGLAFSLAVSFVVFFLVQRIHDPGLRKWGPRWGFTTPGDPASVPWLLLIAGVVSLFLSPVTSGYSRSMEHKSDMFALEVTHLNEPLATAFRKMAEDSKRDPSPHPFIEFWLYSHPPIAKRIPFALSYKPWEKGEPNRMWQP